MVYWAAVVPPNSTNNAIGPTRPAIPMSGRQDVQSIKPGGRPPQSPSPLTPSVIPDARGPRRRGFSAVCWTKRCGSSPARNRTRRSLPHEDAASQKQPFPRLLLGLSREYPTTSAARIAARRSGWRARGGRSHAPTRRLIDINTGAPRSASMAISEWSPEPKAFTEGRRGSRCSPLFGRGRDAHCMRRSRSPLSAQTRMR
jgi:hypothetical protein